MSDNACLQQQFPTDALVTCVIAFRLALVVQSVVLARSLRMFTYQRSVQLPPQTDGQRLLRHLSTCLRQVEARNISVDDDCVVFTGGVFRMVTNWNVLCPFDCGKFAVGPDNQTLTYKLRYRQLLVLSTVMVLAMGLFMFVWHEPAFLLLLPLMWGWLFGANLAIGKNRFNRFVGRSLNSFQVS